MSDARRASTRNGDAAAAATPAALQKAAAQNLAEIDRWRDLVDCVGREIAGSLTTALERVHALTTTGRIDKAGLRALRDELDTARGAGMIAQQLARLSTERLRISRERLSLDGVLTDVLAHRRREVESRGLAVVPSIAQADVMADASLLFGLLNSLLDWSLAHARRTIEFSVEVKAWPSVARLGCRFEHRPPHDFEPMAGGTGLADELDSLTWRLIEQTAAAMGLVLTRTLDDGAAAVAIELPRPAADQPEPVSMREVNDGFALSTNSRPLAGSHVLVIASRRDMRMRVRGAIHHMGLALDLVKSVDEAIDFCREGLPHAIVVEGILRGERLNQLRREILAEVPEFAFIEIVEEGSAFEMSGFGTASMGRVGRDAIESALPSVLMFELSRTL